MWLKLKIWKVVQLVFFVCGGGHDFRISDSNVAFVNFYFNAAEMNAYHRDYVMHSTVLFIISVVNFSFSSSLLLCIEETMPKRWCVRMSFKFMCVRYERRRNACCFAFRCNSTATIYACTFFMKILPNPYGIVNSPLYPICSSSHRCACLKQACSKWYSLIS